MTLNGREVARHEAPPGALPTEVPLDVALPLQEGKNVLLVTATDPDGTTRQEARTIVYEPSAAVAGSRPAPAPTGAGARSQTPRAPAAEKPRAERPTYTLGEKWLRDDGAYELVRIEDDRYVFAVGPDQEIHLTKDLVIARIQKGPTFAEFDTPPALEWPLEVGKWGTGREGPSDSTTFRRPALRAYH